mgnify:CR=1 FL=1
MEKMASQHRLKVPSLKQELFEYPYKYEFHQAAYLLEHIFKKNYWALGEGVAAGEEVVKIKARVSFSAPGSDIYRFDRPKYKDIPPTMHVNFWGIAGIQGPLPQPYTEMIANRIRDHDYAMRDFLDMFNHRLISLVHRIRKKALPCLNTKEPESSPKGISLCAFLGFKDQDTRSILGVDPKAVIYFAALFWQHPRSAVGLKVILENFFKTPVVIHQFQGGWLPLDEDQTTLIGFHKSRFNVLGKDAVLGTKAWRAEKGILIQMGPMDRVLFNKCLKSGSLYPTLVRIIRAYLPQNITFRIQLKLAGSDLSPTVLNSQIELGATSWLLSHSSQQSVDQQVILTPHPDVFDVSLDKNIDDRT